MGNNKMLQDALTGAFARSYLEVRLQEELSHAKATGHPFTLVMLDLDDFKHINDSYGHAVGDAALKYLAEILSGAIRTRRTDVLFRYGGDEFLIILGEIDGERSKLVIERILERLRLHPLNPPGIELKVSLGVASFPQDGDNLGDLLKKADQLLYEAKKLKKR